MWLSLSVSLRRALGSPPSWRRIRQPSTPIRLSARRSMQPAIAPMRDASGPMQRRGGEESWRQGVLAKVCGAIECTWPATIGAVSPSNQSSQVLDQLL